MKAQTPLAILLMIAGLTSFPDQGSGKKIKLVHKMDKATSAISSKALNVDRATRLPADSLIKEQIRFSGYDKPASASKETFHITNNTASILNKVGIRITYLDLQNRMLHSREAEADCIVPAGETRLASIPSWDLQHTFFYHLGPEPKKTATPYKVTIELLWLEN